MNTKPFSLFAIVAMGLFLVSCGSGTVSSNVTGNDISLLTSFCIENAVSHNAVDAFCCPTEKSGVSNLYSCTKLPLTCNGASTADLHPTIACSNSKSDSGSYSGTQQTCQDVCKKQGTVPAGTAVCVNSDGSNQCCTLSGLCCCTQA